VMKPQIKNIIIFLGIVVVLFIIYSVLFTKDKEPEANLTSSNPVNVVPNDGTLNEDDLEIARDFLSLLLSIKSLELDDKIFSDIAFTSLRDTTVPLIHDGSEGRPNPFAPIGTESIVLPAQSLGAIDEEELMEEEDEMIINPFANLLTE
jgi:hypothetical protein